MWPPSSIAMVDIYYIILSYPILSYPILYHTLPTYHTIPYHAITCNAILYYTILYYYYSILVLVINEHFPRHLSNHSPLCWCSEKSLFVKWNNTTYGNLQFVTWCLWTKRQSYSYKALTQNNFRGCFEDIKARTEQCVASDAKLFYCRWIYSSSLLRIWIFFTVTHG